MANDTAKRFLARLKELRKASGLTQEKFAERAGLDYKYYQQVEAGRKVDIRFSTLQKFAAAFGLELYQLLNFDSPVVAVADDRRGVYETKSATTKKKAARKPRSKGRKS